jgi:hypothetical protein
VRHAPGKRIPFISGVSIMAHKSLLQYFVPLILLLPLPGAHAQTELYQFINGSTCDYNRDAAVAVNGSRIAALGTTIYCGIPQPLTPVTGPQPVLSRVAFEGENTSSPGGAGSIRAQACIFISTARFVVVQCGPPSIDVLPGRFSGTAAVPTNDEATGAYIGFTFREGIQSFIYQIQAFWTRTP